MAKRKGNGKRGRRGGGQGDDGSGRARGWARGRGRGRGIPGSYLMDEALDVNIQMYADAQLKTPPYGVGRGGGHARQPSAPYSEPHTPNRGRGRGFRGRGRGRGHPEMNFRDRYSDFGIGASPNGRGRGGGTQNKDAPLTRLLYEDRPLLRPIVFVPSALNPILFDQDEDLLKPGVEEVGDTEQSYLPTAATVSRVFSGGNIQGIESSSEADNDDDSNDDDEAELEEVDFNDVGKLFEQTKKRKKTSSKKSSVEVVEKQFIGAQSILPSTSSLHQPQRDLTDLDSLTKRIDENASAAEKSQEHDVALADASQFYIDIQPTPIPAEIAPPTLFPSDEFDDDIIVYVAPHPRKGIQTSPERQSSTNGVPDTSEFTPYVRDASFSLAVASSSSTKATIEKEQPQPQPQPQPQTQISSISAPPFSFPTPEGKTLGRLSVPPVTISRLALSWKRKKAVLRKKGGKGTKSSFRTFGAMREEAQLHDPKWKERRRGDSDLDWGDTDGDDDDDDDDRGKHDHIADRVDGVESPSGLVYGNGIVIGKDKGKGKAVEVDDDHGMEVDSDLDLHAMQHFVGGLLGGDAGRHVTMDDLKDEAGEERRLEKEQDTEDSRDINESESDESSEDEDAEVERVLADEEAMLISEALEFEDEDEEDDGSEDEDEDQTPRTSFQQRLERLRKQASSSKHEEHGDDDDIDMLERQMLFAEEDDFGYSKACSYFDFLPDSDEEFDYFNRKKSKRRAAGLPDDLKAQWEKDRLKKAAWKKARAEARLEAAADPLSPKKGGKKGRKAMLAVASIDPTIVVLPNRIIDMVTLVQQIKRFIDDEGRQTMALPPTSKATRKNTHDLALAFNLKSISKGNGDARYTTLTKTWKSGLDVDDDKIARILRRKNILRENSFVKKSKASGFQDKKGKKARTGAQALVPRHREGEEVGKAAPKLGSNNLGFRMLAMMGWSEGERIGVSGGIQDPLTAIIKNTKLGLGAAK